MKISHSSTALVGAVLTLLASGFTSGTAFAQDRFGSTSFQSARYCRDAVNGGGNILAANVDCLSGANPDLRRKDTRRDGGDRISINSSSDMSIGGRLVSKVEFGDLDLPTVKSGAWADDDTRVASSISTYMGFTYRGPQASLYALDAVIDWTGSGAPQRIAQGSGDFGGEGFGGFRLWLVDASILPEFTTVDEFISLFTGLSCGSQGVLANNYVDLLRPAGGYAEAALTLDTACGGGALMVEPGKQYALLTFMQTVANRDGYLDATNTIRVKLSETLPEDVRQTLLENVVTARALVPEPASWAMMIAGFGLVGAMARRKRGLPQA